MVRKIKLTPVQDKISKEDMEKYLEAIAKLQERGISLSARIYNLFMMAGLNPKSSVEDWKKFENAAVKLVFDFSAHEKTDMPVENCTFDMLANTLNVAIFLAGKMEELAADPESGKEILKTVKEYFAAEEKESGEQAVASEETNNG